VAGCALLLAAGWRFAYGSGGGPVVLEPVAQREPAGPMDHCPEEGPEEGAGAWAGSRGPAPREDGERSADSGAAAAGAGVVDVNRADAAELQRLPGIGPVLAARIVEHRERWGPFSAPEDLLEVSGIGPRELERIRDRIHIGEPGGAPAGRACSPFIPCRRQRCWRRRAWRWARGCGRGWDARGCGGAPRPGRPRWLWSGGAASGPSGWFIRAGARGGGPEAAG